jgi:hypothetical protein
MRSRSLRRDGKTCRGVPAAAQTSVEIEQPRIEPGPDRVRCPTGATPPITKPVCARTRSASARPSASPASAEAFARPPGCRPRSGTETASPEASPRKMIDFTIWSSCHPHRLGRLLAVRVSEGHLAHLRRDPRRRQRRLDPPHALAHASSLPSLSRRGDCAGNGAVTQPLTAPRALRRHEFRPARAPPRSSPTSPPRRCARCRRFPARCRSRRGTAGCSPYLRGLLEREAEWLAEARLATEPEDALSSVLAEAAALPAREVAAGLRTGQAAHRASRRAGRPRRGLDARGGDGALTRLADAAGDGRFARNSIRSSRAASSPA